MRWEQLGADLAARWDAEDAADLAAEVADRAEVERGRIGLADRLAVAGDVRVQSGAAGWVGGRVVDAGPDWVVLRQSPRDVLIPLAGISQVIGLTGAARDPSHVGPVAARYDLRMILRGLARAGGEVRILTTGGPVIGAIEGVGADDVTLEQHTPAEGSGDRVSIPLAAVVRVELPV